MKSIKVALLAGLIGFVGVAEAEELIAYYKSGYIGDHAISATDALKLTATSGGEALEYTNEHGEWTLIIDENSPSDAQAWCANTVKYNDFAFTIAKVIIKRDFTFKPGVTAALFDNVEIEVAEGVKLTMTNYGSRNMSLGAVTFSGDGEVDASSGVTLTKPITTKGNVTVKTPDNTFVANVDGTDYLTLQAAFDAAKSSGTITLLKDIGAISPVPSELKDSTAWQGTLVMSGTMPDGFDPANYGNAKSTIEFKGVSGGYLILHGSFDGTLKVTNDGTKTGWLIENGYSGQDFVFGALTGTGDIIDSGVATQQYSFKDGSTFGGSISTVGKKFVFGSKVASSTATIVIDEGATANLAEGKTWSATNGIVINGRLTAAGVLGSATSLGANGVIDVAEDETCTIATINSDQLTKTGAGALKISAWSKVLNNLSIEGEIVNGVFKDSNNIMISVLTLTGNARFAGLGFGFTGTANLGSHTLRIATKPQTTTDKSWYQNFSVKDATLNGTGAIVVEDGSKLLISTASKFANGTLEVLSGGACEKSGNFTVSNVVLHNGGSFSGNGQVVVSGTLSGDGTVDKLTFANDATIDPSAGLPTVTSVTYGSSIIVKAKPGDDVFKANATPADTVTIKDADGKVQPLWSLKNENGTIKLSGDVKKLSDNESWTVDAATAANFPTPLVLDLTDYYGEGGGKPVGETAHTVITFPVGTNASTYLSTIQVVYPTLHAAGELTAEGNKIFFTFGHLDLYWNAWRGTFWEAVYGGDKNGNKGLGRTASGEKQAILAGDTVIFDQTHYASEDYWHYDQNLYIKDEVNPGVNNDWDLKVLEGVTLKMGLRGARATGQNIIKDFKIYVDENSTLELGYWGNTHHYQGVIRPDVTFGGAGTITLGDDMGASCRIEGDLKVKQDPSAQETEVPTLDVRGKELVVQGGQIDVNLTGFGALSGSGTITTPIAFTNATISATPSPGFTFKNETTFTGTLTVDMARAPTGEELIKICTKGEGGSFSFTEGIDVLVRVNGSVQPAFYTLATDNDGNLCVKVAPTPIEYGATVRLGYDYKTMIVDVDMNPAIAGVVAEVTVAGVEGKLQHWSAPVVGMRNQGRAEVMVGDADDNFAPGTYSMTVSVGSWHKDLEFTLAAQNGGNLAEVNRVGYKTMREAVAAAEAARGTGNGTIKLLTNVFFAPPPGDYDIDNNGYNLYITNDMEMSAQGSAVTITAPETIDHYVIWTGYPFVIEGNWLGYALPWKTKLRIQEALVTASETNGLKPFEAYVLGILAAEMGTYKPIVYGVQTDDPNTIELTDNLPTKDVAETGVVVTKKIIDEKTKEELSATTTYDLRNMDGKSKLLKLDYSFASDGGQG